MWPIFNKENVKEGRVDVSEQEYIKQHPFVNDTGIYMPSKEYVRKGFVSEYRLVMSKEMFVEAYNKWIKEAQ